MSMTESQDATALLSRLGFEVADLAERSSTIDISINTFDQWANQPDSMVTPTFTCNCRYDVIAGPVTSA